jgi:hypothetical protein
MPLGNHNNGLVRPQVGQPNQIVEREAQGNCHH